MKLDLFRGELASSRYKAGRGGVNNPLNSINTGTVTRGKIPMFVGSQDGGNNYECRKQF